MMSRSFSGFCAIAIAVSAGVAQAGAKPSMPSAAPVACKASGPVYVAPLGTGDGSSPKSALPSIAAAVQHAKTIDACALDVRLAAGTHADTSIVETDRPTKITGAGRGATRIRGGIQSRDAHALELRELTIDAPSGTAIDVRNSKATTTLARIAISGASGFGVVQHGGTIALDGVVISGTRVLPDVLGTGVAMNLAASVTATATGLVLTSNDGQAITLTGKGTKLVLRNATVSDTGHHPKLAVAVAAADTFRTVPAAGTIRVDDHATLLADGLRMHDNDYVGILTLGGGKTHVKDLDLRKVADIDEHLASFGVYVGDGGAVELHDFSIRQSEGAGIGIHRGRIRASDGLVGGNPIGVSIVPAEGDSIEGALWCMGESVRWDRNRRTLDALTLPVPDTAGFGDGSVGAAGVCASVPWVE